MISFLKLSVPLKFKTALNKVQSPSFIRNVSLQEPQPHILPPVNAIPAAPVNDAILELANLSSDALAEKVVSSVLDAGESSGGEGSRSDSNDPIDQISR